MAWKRSPIQGSDGRPRSSFKMTIWDSEILNIIKSDLHLELVYCSRSATHFISLASDTNSMLVFLLENRPI